MYSFDRGEKDQSLSECKKKGKEKIRGGKKKMKKKKWIWNFFGGLPPSPWVMLQWLEPRDQAVKASNKQRSKEKEIKVESSIKRIGIYTCSNCRHCVSCVCVFLSLVVILSGNKPWSPELIINSTSGDLPFLMDDGIYLPFHADFSFTPYGGVFFKKFNSGEREREREKI